MCLLSYCMIIFEWDEEEEKIKKNITWEKCAAHSICNKYFIIVNANVISCICIQFSKNNVSAA